MVRMNSDLSYSLDSALVRFDNAIVGIDYFSSRLLGVLGSGNVLWTALLWVFELRLKIFEHVLSQEYGR